MLERDIEKRLTRLVKELGGLCYKFVSPGNDGVPDRIIITPKGTVWFAELKTETGRLSPRQRLQIDRLSGHGCNVVTVYGWEDAEKTIRTVFDSEI